MNLLNSVVGPMTSLLWNKSSTSIVSKVNLRMIRCNSNTMIISNHLGLGIKWTSMKYSKYTSINGQASGLSPRSKWSRRISSSSNHQRNTWYKRINMVVGHVGMVMGIDNLRVEGSCSQEKEARGSLMKISMWKSCIRRNGCGRQPPGLYPKWMTRRVSSMKEIIWNFGCHLSSLLSMKLVLVLSIESDQFLHTKMVKSQKSTSLRMSSEIMESTSKS